MTVQAATPEADAREFPRRADPVLARLIDAHPEFSPRAWLEKLPPTDAFGMLVFEDEMAALAERWRPYRSLAVSYLFASEFEEET